MLTIFRVRHLFSPSYRPSTKEVKWLAYFLSPSVSQCHTKQHIKWKPRSLEHCVRAVFTNGIRTEPCRLQMRQGR
jgi:hypothetical protein